MRDREYKRRNNNALAGLILLAIGGVWLVKQMGVYMPSWVFTWPMILIAVGLFVGLKNSFRDYSWLIMTGIGVYFLIDDWWPAIPMQHYVWPVIIIGIGLTMILAPRRGFRRWRDTEKDRDYKDTSASQDIKADSVKADPVTTPYEERKASDEREELLDITSIFAGFKKVVYTKNFAGGDVVCIFGGGDIDLSQADFHGTIIIDLVHIFGGSKIIVPPNWEVRTEAAVIFGGVEDKRRGTMPYDKNKLVILKGAIIFGGVELKSYK